MLTLIAIIVVLLAFFVFGVIAERKGWLKKAEDEAKAEVTTLEGKAEAAVGQLRKDVGDKISGDSTTQS